MSDGVLPARPNRCETVEDLSGYGHLQRCAGCVEESDTACRLRRSGRLRTPGAPPPRTGNDWTPRPCNDQQASKPLVRLGARPSQRDAHLGPIWPNDISTWARTRSSPTPGNSVYPHGLTRALIRRSGGQGVASSRSRRPDQYIPPIRPSRTCIQPAFLPPSMTPSGGLSRPTTDHQAENAVPASSMACTSGCR